MDDRELLELAAKACGGKVLSRNDFGDLYQIGEKQLFWEPLDNDGDAFRLAVSLSMRIYVYGKGGDDCTCVANDELNRDCSGAIEERHCGDALAATRRAIVRAAAQVGKSMP